MELNANKRMPGEGALCLRCNYPLVRVDVSDWNPKNLILKQLQKFADSSGVRIYHCQKCGKVEFFR